VYQGIQRGGVLEVSKYPVLTGQGHPPAAHNVGGTMHWLGLIISLLIIGLIAGALARLLVPGRQNMSIGMTLVLGLIGSFVGGFLGYLLFHKDSQDGFLQPAGIIGSIIAAVIVLLIWKAISRRGSRVS